MPTKMLIVISLFVLLAGPAPAQQDHGRGHQPHTAPAPALPDDEIVRAYVAAMDRMHEAMATMAYSGDPDIDFAQGMIPHHQAAIEMAQIVLEHGSDPTMRELALAIIEAQEREIAELEAWLAEHAGD
jgi:uncharacterized protein (DUF305 family)